jgi:hypothetical protein
MTHIYISSIVVVVLAHQFFDIQTEEALAAFLPNTLLQWFISN